MYVPDSGFYYPAGYRMSRIVKKISGKLLSPRCADRYGNSFAKFGIDMCPQLFGLELLKQEVGTSRAGRRGAISSRGCYKSYGLTSPSWNLSVDDVALVSDVAGSVFVTSRAWRQMSDVADGR